VLGADAVEVAPEVVLDCRRQHRPAVLVALAASNHDQVGAEIHVLHAETTALENAEAGAIEEAGHEPRWAGEPLEHGPHLVAGENDWQSLGSLCAHDVVEPRQVDRQHVTIEEQERAQGLVLGGGGDASLDGEGAQEPRDLGRAQLDGMALAVEEDEPADPGNVGLLGPAAVMTGAQGLANAVEQTGLGRVGGRGFPDREGREAFARDGIQRPAERRWRVHTSSLPP